MSESETDRTHPPVADLSSEDINSLIQQIEESGALGRSRIYRDLLHYLGNTAISGVTSKEITIAIEVLGKDADFDVSSDSLVRVYIHKLRQKLEAYYRHQGKNDAYQLAIPKGQYTLQVLARDPNSEEADIPSHDHTSKPHRANQRLLIGLGLALVVINLLYLAFNFANQRGAFSPMGKLASSPLWRPILDDDRPVLLVIGDYYIFGEKRGPDMPDRLIREFHVNSPRDLGRYMRNRTAAGDPSTYYNMGLTYTPRASAFAIKDVIPVLSFAGKPIEIRMSSEITGADLKSQHIIYLGYISAMRDLRELAFSASQFAIGASYDELIRIDTGARYISEEIVATGEGSSFSDLGMLSSIPLIDGHQLMIIAGTRDTGLMHMAQLAGQFEHLQPVNRWLEEWIAPGPIAFETFYQVMGFDGINFNAEQIHIGELEYQQLWGVKSSTATE